MSRVRNSISLGSVRAGVECTYAHIKLRPNNNTTTQQTQQTHTHTHNSQQPATSNQQPATTSLHSSVSLSRCDLCRVNFMWAAEGAAHAGAARRWRERRLRAYLRYARMSVVMALAEATHHTAPRGGVGERRDELRHGPDDSSPGKHGVLQHGRRVGCACRPADTSR